MKSAWLQPKIFCSNAASAAITAPAAAPRGVAIRKPPSTLIPDPVDGRDVTTPAIAANNAVAITT